MGIFGGGVSSRIVKDNPDLDQFSSLGFVSGL